MTEFREVSPDTTEQVSTNPSEPTPYIVTFSPGPPTVDELFPAEGRWEDNVQSDEYTAQYPSQMVYSQAVLLALDDLETPLTHRRVVKAISNNKHIGQYKAHQVVQDKFGKSENTVLRKAERRAAEIVVPRPRRKRGRNPRLRNRHHEQEVIERWKAYEAKQKEKHIPDDRTYNYPLYEAISQPHLDEVPTSVKRAAQIRQRAERHTWERHDIYETLDVESLGRGIIDTRFFPLNSDRSPGASNIYIVDNDAVYNQAKHSTWYLGNKLATIALNTLLIFQGKNVDLVKLAKQCGVEPQMLNIITYYLSVDLWQDKAKTGIKVTKKGLSILPETINVIDWRTNAMLDKAPRRIFTPLETANKTTPAVRIKTPERLKHLFREPLEREFEGGLLETELALRSTFQHSLRRRH